MNLLKEKWQVGKKAVVNSIALVFPGLLTALFIFYISSNRLFPDNKDLTIFLLNFLQIYMLGITVIKYGIDQIILSRLNAGNQIILKEFFKKRVLPLTFIFVLTTWFIKGSFISFFLALCLPLEIFIIIVSVELNISDKFWTSTILKLLGYPFFFILIYIANALGHVSPKTVLSLFLISTLIRLGISFFVRNKGQKEAVADLSYHVPLQQVGNFFLFRLDQIVIAFIISMSLFIDQAQVGYYLFFAKFPEMVGSVIIAMAPLIYKRLSDKLNISFTNLLFDKLFLLISIGLCFLQILICFFIFKPIAIENNVQLFIPFLFSTLFILPVNLIIYIYYKNGDLYKLNVLNVISILLGVLALIMAVILRSITLFSIIIPFQLFLFIIFHKILFYNKKP